MYTIKFTSTYKKSYKRISKRGYDLSLLNDVVDMLRRGVELPEQYRDHILQGEYKGFHECHIKPDWLLIYTTDSERLILTCSRTGSHSELFRF